MRLFAPLFSRPADPDAWIATLRQSGYTASQLPLPIDTPDDVAAPWLAAAAKADIVIAEVGAWSNPIDPDSAKAAEALEKCRRSLAWAERIGARNCVNISGSRNPDKWDGPHPENFARDTFDRIVESTRSIIDAVKPKRTFFTLETMPWIYPSSPDEYTELIRAIDRPAFAVHLDPVNMINCPARAYRTGEFIRECFAKLGPWIKSCHAKDIILRENLTVHLDECRPGLGMLDYHVFLAELSRLDPGTPLGLEHLQTEEEYNEAAGYVRGVAREIGVSV